VVVTSATMGCVPFQVMVAANLAYGINRIKE
jgi:hypothetical protein